MSGYAVTAQFYDAMAGEQHAAVDAQIAEALTGLETAGCPVVDIGAGTGLTTSVIAKALPEVEILAVEPDPAMRSALMTRVWSDPDLRRRVSILPMPLLSAPLPPVISAAVASASLVHFNPRERAELWAMLARRLSPTGCAVIEIQCPIDQDIAETCMATSRVGQVDYEGWVTAKRIDDVLPRLSYDNQVLGYIPCQSRGSCFRQYLFGGYRPADIVSVLLIDLDPVKPRNVAYAPMLARIVDTLGDVSKNLVVVRKAR